MMPSMDRKIPVLCSDAECTGCSACANSCSKDAISMEANNEGFLYPKINNERCVGCLACEKSCPVINATKLDNTSNPRTFACWNNDKDARAESSSGGAFSALATAVIRHGGIVIGAAYDENMAVKHKIIKDIAGLQEIRGSKYVQSEIGDIFKKVKDLAKQGITILFVGTPCQINGLRTYLKRDYANLYLCDFICHGVPSPLLFKEYINWIEDKKGIKITAFNFRSKRSGWYDAIRVANKKIPMKGKYDSYFFGFNKDITLRESCYRCPAIGIPRKGDLTIADFWGIGMRYKFDKAAEIADGISLMMLNNDKGSELFHLAKDYMTFEERDFNEALERNKPMIVPSNRPLARDTFYQDLRSHGYGQVAKSYFKQGNKTRCVSWLRENAPRSVVVGIRNALQTLIWKRNGSKALPK